MNIGNGNNGVQVVVVITAADEISNFQQSFVSPYVTILIAKV